MNCRDCKVKLVNQGKNYDKFCRKLHKGLCHNCLLKREDAEIIMSRKRRLVNVLGETSS